MKLTPKEMEHAKALQAASNELVRLVKPRCDNNAELICNVLHKAFIAAMIESGVISSAELSQGLMAFNQAAYDSIQQFETAGTA